MAELTPKEQSKNNGRLLLIVIAAFIIVMAILWLTRKSPETKALQKDKAAVESKIKVAEAKRDSNISGEVIKAKSAAEKSTKIIKTLKHEKDITTPVADDSIASYIAKYKYN